MVEKVFRDVNIHGQLFDVYVDATTNQVVEITSDGRAVEYDHFLWESVKTELMEPPNED